MRCSLFFFVCLFLISLVNVPAPVPKINSRNKAARVFHDVSFTIVLLLTIESGILLTRV